MKKILLIILGVVIFICFIVFVCKTITYKDEGYFKDEDYIISNSNIKITSKNNNEIKIYSEKIELEYPNTGTKIGWNKKYVVIEYNGKYTIIDIESENIKEELSRKEYKKKKDKDIINIKLKTIGRYLLINN